MPRFLLKNQEELIMLIFYILKKYKFSSGSRVLTLEPISKSLQENRKQLFITKINSDGNERFT